MSTHSDENVIGGDVQPAEPRPTVAAIKAHIAAFVARELRVKVADIDTSAPFEHYGLGSVQAVVLAGELEEWLGLDLPATLAYDYPTIDALAGYLSDEPGTVTEEEPSAGTGPVGDEPIAIIGIGCRFPGASGPQAFWRLLSEGVDAISEVPADRWPVDAYTARWGGFLPDIDRFDCEFFGIAPREAVRMDPQQRLLLEVAWEAFEDAGLVPEALAGTAVGVFVGVSTNDYGYLQSRDTFRIDAYVGTGSALSIAANRLSYVFDLRGPSIAVDTACSSSLVAVHLAVESLRHGTCRVALAAGVNAILAPAITVNFSKAGVLAADGRCKAFDRRADGYARSEGCGVLVLKPLRHALADHDPIYAVIRGSAINQDGRTNGLMAPSRPAQEGVLRAAYHRAGVDPLQVQYVEAHGSGTLLGDPIEAAALGSVLGRGRAADQPCRVGSVKSNLGHLEAAAGVAGLIKTALAIRHRWLPPSLHFHRPNPHIPFADLGLRVQGEPSAWPDPAAPLVAGVSAFGFGGTNAHVVVEQGPAAASAPPPAEAESAMLLPLSARTPIALRALARAYLALVQRPHGDALRDLSYTLSTRRTHHAQRLAVVAADRVEAATTLEQFLDGAASPGWLSGSCRPDGQRTLVFVFPGQGSEWPGMGRELMRREPTFRATAERAAAAVLRWGGPAVLDALVGRMPDSRLAEIDVVQPTLFVLQTALATLWRSWGVEPDAVLGHSMGEIAAAYVAGALDLDAAARVVCGRSRLMRESVGRGGMLVAGVSPSEAGELLEGYGRRASIAVHSSPRTVVISGEPATLAALERVLQRRDVFCRRLPIDVAAHGPQLDSASEWLAEELQAMEPHAPRVPFYSTVLGGLIGDVRLDSAYWARNLREPVLFAPAVTAALNHGHRTLLELSPHLTLVSAVAQCADDVGDDGSGDDTLLIPSMRRDAADPRIPLLRSLGALFVRGLADPKCSGPPSGRVIAGPQYPWQDERLWFDGTAPVTATSASSAAPPDGFADWLYQLHWEPTTQPPVRQPDPATWLVLSDTTGVGAALTDLLRSAGHRVVVVHTGEADDIQRLLDAIGSGGRLLVVHLWSLDAEPYETMTVAKLEQAQLLGCATVLRLLQVLARTPDGSDCRLHVVTRGSQAVDDGAPCHGLAAAPLWGLGRSAQQEVPHVWGGLLDLDPDAHPSASARQVVAECTAQDGESEVAYREGVRRVPRLHRASVDTTARPPTLRKDGAYLVAGGLGDLGLQIARRFVERGASRLILLGRTGLPKRAAWGAVPPGTRQAEQIAAVRDLESIGASVHLGTVDVSCEDQLVPFLEQYRAEGWPPIRGVVHAAGIVELRTLLELDHTTLCETLRPKVLGGWLLHRSLTADPIDFFVSYASAAGVLGSPRLAHYAAANCFLDALAQQRRSCGLPALAIDWGLWDERGTAARHLAEGHTLLRGAEAISVPDGLAMLDELMGQDLAQIGVLRVDWPEWARRYPSFSAAPLLRHLVEPPTAAARVSGDALELTVGYLRRLASDERRRALEVQLSRMLADVLRLTSERIDKDTPLNQLGIDSLMAVELRNGLQHRLQVAIPMVRLLEGASVAELAEEISEILGALAPAPAPTDREERMHWDADEIRGARATELLNRLDQLSDDEVAALLEDLEAGG